MGLRSKGLVLAMEEDAVVEDDFSSNEIPETVAEVEVDASEIQEDTGVIEDISEAIEDASDDMDTLEGIQGVMEESVEKGEGLDETAAEIAEVAIEAICARLGISKANKIMPAMESFGSSNSRVAATKIAMEGVGDTLKRIWQAIKDAFAKAWNHIVDFYKKHIASLGRLSKYADSLKAKAKESASKKPKKDSEGITSSAVLSAFNIGGKVDAKTTGDILSAHLALTGNVVSAKTLMQKSVKDLLDGTDKLDSFDPAGFRSLSNKLNTELHSNVKELVGGYTMAEHTGSDVEGGVASRLIAKFTAAQAKSKAEKAPVLELAEIEKILESVSNLIKKSEAYNSELKFFTGVVDSIKKIADANISNADKLAEATNQSPESKEKLATIRKETEAYMGALQRITTSIPSLNFRAAKSALSYVNDSLNQYEAAK